MTALSVCIHPVYLLDSDSWILDSLFILHPSSFILQTNHLIILLIYSHNGMTLWNNTVVDR